MLLSLGTDSNTRTKKRREHLSGIPSETWTDSARPIAVAAAVLRPDMREALRRSLAHALCTVLRSLLEIRKGNQCCTAWLCGLLFSEAQLGKISCIRIPEPTIQVAYEWHKHKHVCKHKHDHGWESTGVTIHMYVAIEGSGCAHPSTAFV